MATIEDLQRKVRDAELAHTTALQNMQVAEDAASRAARAERRAEEALDNARYDLRLGVGLDEDELTDEEIAAEVEAEAAFMRRYPGVL